MEGNRLLVADRGSCSSTPSVLTDARRSASGKVYRGQAGAVVVITVAADPSVAAVHDRMPAIVGLEAARAWLAGSAEEAMGVVGPVAGVAEPVC